MSNQTRFLVFNFMLRYSWSLKEKSSASIIYGKFLQMSKQSLLLWTLFLLLAYFIQFTIKLKKCYVILCPAFGVTFNRIFLLLGRF